LALVVLSCYAALIPAERAESARASSMAPLCLRA